MKLEKVDLAKENLMANENPSTSADDDRYLVFLINGQSYGTPLLKVREVVERYTPKPIPNAPTYFAGVVNIRGEIVGVIDLRIRFGHKSESDPRQALIVLSTSKGPMACLVDQVDSVISLKKPDIEKQVNAAIGIKDEAILGVVKNDGNLTVLVDLITIVEASNNSQLKKTAEEGKI